MWAFKQLHEKGLVYEGFRVLPYCWQDETPLSNHELRMDDDVYQMRQDPAVTVGYDVTTEGGMKGVKVLVWTTTPWTLPSNLAVMVGEDIDYVVVESDGPTGSTERYLIAEARLASYARELGEEPTVTWRGTGADLIGLEYAPPFCYYAGHERAFRLVPAEFVTTTDGTGLVHTAGAFGEDDKVVTDREGIEAVMPVGKDGRFTFPVTDYEGMQVFDANLHVIDHLKAATTGDRRDRERHPRHRPRAPRDLRPLLPALLALPPAPDLQGRLVVVRRGDQGQGAPDRAQPGHPLGARPHQGRPVRQVAGERPRLVDHPQPLLGQPGPGVEVRRRALPAHRRLRLLRGDRARLRPPAARPGRQPGPAPALRRRADAPQPRRPDGEVHDAPRHRRPRRVVRLGLDERSPRCTTRSRTRTGSTTTSPATSSSSTSARPAAGSTRCTSWPARSSTARRSRRA